jgi:hypothetical protein
MASVVPSDANEEPRPATTGGARKSILEVKRHPQSPTATGRWATLARRRPTCNLAVNMAAGDKLAVIIDELRTMQARRAFFGQDQKSSEEVASFKNQQAQKYVPKPLDLDHILVPADLDPVLDSCAALIHRMWCQEHLKDHWTHGAVLDENLHTHPLLVPFHELPVESMTMNINSVTQTVKVLLYLGFRITRASSDSVAHHAVGGSVEHEHAAGLVGTGHMSTADIPVPAELDDAIEILAFQQHEIWSRQKIEDGFTYAAVRTPSENPALLPYFILSPDEQKNDKDASRNCLRCIFASGYDIKRDEDHPTSSAMKDISRLMLQETQTQANELFNSVSLVREMDEHTSMMLRIEQKTMLHLRDSARQDSNHSLWGRLVAHVFLSNHLVHENSQCLHNRVMHPEAVFVLLWHCCILLLVVVGCFETTYALSFGESQSQESQSGTWGWATVLGLITEVRIGVGVVWCVALSGWMLLTPD